MSEPLAAFPPSGLGVAVSRRTFLSNTCQALGVGALMGGAGGLLAACGGSTSTQPKGNSAAADSGVTLQDVKNAKGTVKVLGWQYYQVPQENTASVGSHWGYLGNNEGTITKTTQPGAFDLLTILAGYDPELLAAGRVIPTNPDLIPNWKNVDPVFRNSPTLRHNGQLYSLPFQWGYGYLEWDTRHTTRPTSLADLMSPKLRGRVGLPDDPYGTMTTFAVLLGFKTPQQLTRSEFNKLIATLDAFRPQVRVFHPYGEEPALLAAGDIYVDFPSYGPSFLTADKAGAKMEIEYFGSWSYVDCLIMVRGATHVPQALAFMNHCLEPSVQEAVVRQGAAFPVVDAAVSAVPPQLRYQSAAAVLAKAPLEPGVPVTGAHGYVPFSEWLTAWESYKAL